MKFICIIGFVCSGGFGAVYIFEKTDEKEMFKKIKEIRIPIDQQSADPSLTCNQQITCIALSPSEETVVCSTNSNQLYSIPLSSADLGKVIFLKIFTFHAIDNNFSKVKNTTCHKQK